MAVVDSYGNPVRSGSGAAVGSLYDSNNGNNNTTNTGRTTTTGSVVTPLDLANITGGNYPYNFLNIQDTGGNPNTQGNTYANAPSLFTQSDTGAYYPDSVPDTMFKGLGSGLTGGLTNLLLEKLGGKLGKDSYLGGLLDAYINFDPLGDFAEQTQFGMNKESMLEYKLQESSNPEWATMSETERVAMARSPQLTNQLTYAFIAGGQGNLTEAQLDSIRPEGFSDEQWDGLSKQMKSQLSQSGSGRGVFDDGSDRGDSDSDSASNNSGILSSLGVGTAADSSEVLANLMNGNSNLSNGANMADTISDAGWLSQQYQNEFNRSEMDEAGEAYWLGQLSSGAKDRERVLADLRYSQEGQGYTTQAEADTFARQIAEDSDANFINTQYNQQFGRNVGQEGLDFYENQLATGAKTREQVIAELGASNEGVGNITAAEAAADPTLTASASRMDEIANPFDNIQAQLAQYVTQNSDDESTVDKTGNLSSIQALLDQFKAESGGAAIPDGTGVNTGNFKPVTFRSGTGGAALTPSGSATQLSEPYASISDMVGQGQGLFGQASTLAQQAPDQFNYNFNPEGRATELFNQRSALLEPSFAQQNARAREGMFGTGRLGLRLSGEGLGAGSGSQMMQPDALGVSNAQSQALAGLAQQSTNDAYNQQMQQAGLDLNQFNTNQMTNQQQYANLMGTGAGMFSGGLQAPALEAQLAGAPLQTEALRQNYQLGLLGQETARMTGQAALNTSNYQPNPWVTGLTGIGTAYAGTAGGGKAIDKAGGWLWNAITGG